MRNSAGSSPKGGAMNSRRSPPSTIPAARARIPDPQAVKTFTDSKLVWDEVRDEKKSMTFELYRKCLALRRLEAAFRPASRDTWHVEALEMGVGALRIKGVASDWLLLFDLEGGHTGSLAEEWICKPRGPEGWAVVLSTNEKQFGGTGVVRLRFRGKPGALQPAGTGRPPIMSEHPKRHLPVPVQQGLHLRPGGGRLPITCASLASRTFMPRLTSRHRPAARTGMMSRIITRSIRRSVRGRITTAYVEALKRNGLGQIVDFVPNHMGIGPLNPYWMDVLENGRGSQLRELLRHRLASAQGGAGGQGLAPHPGRPIRAGARKRGIEAQF